MKKVLSLALAAIMVLALCSCSTNGDGKTTTAANDATTTEAYQAVDMNVLGLKGPTGMGMAKMISDSKTNGTANNYKFTISGDPTSVVAGITTGEYDIAACPMNMASVIYNKTNGGVKILAINTLGILHILDKTGTVKQLSDLKGKTVVTSGQGASPEYILNYILEKNGLKDDVKVEYLSEHSEVATAILTGKADIVMLPEPNVTVVTSKDSSVKIAIDMTQEWNKISDVQLAMGAVIARKDFVEKNGKAVDKFLEEYKNSVDYINTSAEAGTAIAEAGIVDNAALAQKAIPGSNITLLTGAQLKAAAEANLNVLFTANPASVGGKLPGADFYYG
ncbi:MAG: ABC transporter substrate-binding protein [Clostridia bacterium]|nr:ABC transporter substrate-binding protein [Clostridia bacterium]